MRWLGVWFSRLSAMFDKEHLDRQLDEEIEGHLALEIEEYVRGGMSYEKARRSALLRFGSVESAKEAYREQRGLQLIDEFIRDLRFGLRLLNRNRILAVVAVATLALGIGVNVGVFSILDPLLLRKLPVADPDDLVLIHSSGTLGSLDISEQSAFEQYRRQDQVFNGVLAFGELGVFQTKRNGQGKVANGQPVSGEYFSTLGVRTAQGRAILSEDDRRPGGNPVIVLSYDYWQKDYSGDPSIVGQAVEIDGLLYTIVGVAPRSFHGLEVGVAPDFYIPMAAPASGYSDPSSGWVTVFARLRKGISINRAYSALQPLFPQIASESQIPRVERDQVMARLVLSPGATGISALRTKFALPVQVLMGVVALILLLACSNVANLLLAQGVHRSRELTMRALLGATRMRIVRQLLLEGSILAIFGAIIGVTAAKWASEILVRSFSPVSSTASLQTELNGRVLLFAISIAILAVVLCGVAPAFVSTRGQLSSKLKIGLTGIGYESFRTRLSRFLMVAQVAFSAILLTLTGLLLHSLINLNRFDPGFDRERVLVGSLEGDGTKHSAEEVRSVVVNLLARVRTVPGVQSACLASFAPISGHEFGINVSVEDNPNISPEQSHVFFASVTPGYFETLGITILRGRDFTEHDTQSTGSVAVINRTMARRYFGERNPIGRRFKFIEGNRGYMQIIGVVADSKYNSLREATPDFVYLSQWQGPMPNAIHSTLFLRMQNRMTRGLTSTLAETIHSLDGSLAFVGIRTLGEQIADSLQQERLIATFCGVLSALALLLTCIGLYGSFAFSVARRTQEIGVRMALGADRNEIFGLVIGQALKLTLLGTVIGGAVALSTSFLIASLLFGVQRGDPITFLTIALVLLVSTILACYVPARRAMDTQPLTALRYE